MTRSAIIGLGRMGAEPSVRLEDKIGPGWLPVSHAEAIRSVDGLELVALCDNDEEKLSRFSQLYKVYQLYTNYRSMLDEVRPDILSIATRTDIRCDIIHNAIEFGVKGIYAEKPISRSVNECRRAMDIVKARKIKLVYGATRRAMEIYRLAKKICCSGELGELQHISTEFGRAPLLWSLPHAADLIIFFTNSFTWIQAQGNCLFDWEDFNAQKQLLDSDPKVNFGYYLFDNGISASMIPGEGTNIRLHCTKGVITVNGDGHHIEINKQGKFPAYFHDYDIITANAEKSGTQNLFSELAEAVRADLPVTSIQPEEIVAGQELLFATVQSALAKGIIVTPDSLNTELIITGRSGKFYA